MEPDHGGHSWADFSPSLTKYDHWLWQKVGEDAVANGGHGGMDYIMAWRTIQSMRTGTIADIDVYDSAAWCAPVPLSVMSLADGGKPVEIPDFTRGGWVRPRGPGFGSHRHASSGLTHLERSNNKT